MSKLSVLVNKLGHELEEIRLRALCSIISKLDNGLISEEELIDKDNLFQNLTKWFQFKNAPAQREVLNLVVRLIRSHSDAGVLLMKADPALAVFREIDDCEELVQDIVDVISKQVDSTRYTKSDESKDGPKALDSARISVIKGGHSLVSHRQSARSSNTVGSQSTLGPSLATWDKPELPRVEDLPTERTIHTVSSLRPVSVRQNVPAMSSLDRVIWSLPRVPLVASDLHVISTVQDSLSSSSVTQTCHFFISVMLQDFPPQVFLQNPGVVWQLISLLRKPTPINVSSVECLAALTQLLLDQLIVCSQLEFTSNKCQQNGSEDSGTPRDVAQKYHQHDGYLSRGRDLQTTTKTGEPLSIPQYCLMVLPAAAQLVCVVTQASPLMLSTLQLLSAVTPDSRTLLTHPHLSELLRGLLEELTAQVKQSVSYETVVEVHIIAVTFQILDTLVPVDLASAVLPTQLQEILCFSLIDPMLVVNYPELHTIAMNFANKLKHKGTQVYEEVSSVMEAMKASVHFSQKVTSLFPSQALQLFKESLPALPFHRNLNVIEEFIQYMLERPDLTETDVEQAAEVTRSLLAHSDIAIASETYRVCHNVVTSVLGPRQTLSNLDPGPRLAILTHTSVLVEVTCFGVTSPDNRIQQNAEDILTYLLKCQLLVSEHWWRRLLEQLSPVLPLLQCHTNKTSPLGRAVLHMLDPDIANCAILTNLQVLSGNARLLFHKDTVVREEAVARLLWHTGLSDPHNKRLADLCVLDVALTGHTPVTGMYEASSVVRVVELLSVPYVEARVRQSAITQLSVMTEDSRLHQVFIDHRGVQLFLSILQQVMEDINEDTGCYVIPIVATLKHLARHNPTIRQTLSQHEQFLLCLLKSMFQLSEWRLQRDGAQLLALLLYADYVLSCAASVSLPHLVTQTLHLPWPCQSHWTVSPHSTPSLRGVVLGEMGVERLLSAQWAILTEGLDCLLNLPEVTERNTPLALSQRTLRQLQASNVPHGCRCTLYAFQNATTHLAALQALAKLTLYLELSWLTETSTLSSLPWKSTFRRFLLIPPSGQDDFNLLFLVLKFLHFLLEVCPDQSTWISESLLSPPHTLLQLIMIANSASHDQEMWKKICLSTLEVCKRCMHCNVGNSVSSSDWQVVVTLIMRCLGQSHSQEYYSLALLDSKLQVLLAAVGRGQLCDSAANLWQLLTAFHCESPHSFMGLSITRNTVLCLNKMLTLSQDWECEWLGEPNIRWLVREGGLCISVDVVVRATALSLMSGLARTPRGAATLLDTCPDMVHFAMGTVVDHSEASIVRENASLLLTNIVKHSNTKELMETAKDVSLFQEFRESVNLVTLTALQSHIEPSTGMLHTDPNFVKAGCWLITNLLLSSVDEMIPVVSSSGVITALCRTLQSVDRLMCRETVSLVAAACRLLTVCCAAGCDIPQLTDCVTAIMSFLDPDSFAYDLADSSEEVKSLWQEALRLLSHMLGSMGGKVILTPAAVTVLSQCVAIADPQCATLRLTALQAVPVLSKSLTPNSEAVLCEKLVAQWDRVKGKTKSALLAALTALLGSSRSATTTALSLGLVALVITRLREIHLTLTVQTSSTDKLAKKDPRMGEMLQLVHLLSAALYDSEAARCDAANHGAADVIHKLWAWCHADDKYLISALNCLVTFTADCPLAAGSLVLTSTMPGTSQRKSPTAHSLAHAVITMVTREQHSVAVTGCALTLLRHCCQAQDTRTVLGKSALLSKWSDLLSDRRIISEEIEELWFHFVLTFTFYPEGQTTLPKTGELFTQLVMNVESGRSLCRARAVAILRNLATHSANKPRLLSNKRLLQALGEVLLSGGKVEQQDVALVVWSLAANSQKAKMALRSEGLVQRLTLASATATDNHVFSLVIDLLQQR